jgi:hypothetical protein
METLKINIKNNPNDYVHDPIVGSIAHTFLEKEELTSFKAISLLKE